jgi:hypothetical protein
MDRPVEGVPGHSGAVPPVGLPATPIDHHDDDRAGIEHNLKLHVDAIYHRRGHYDHHLLVARDLIDKLDYHYRRPNDDDRGAYNDLYDRRTNHHDDEYDVDDCRSDDDAAIG